MKNIIQDYPLKFYVRDMYPKRAAENGGCTFKPFYKKDFKPFQMRVKCAINMSKSVLDNAKHKFSDN
jgi:hypothetical protein